jgi:hypothetical protein
MKIRAKINLAMLAAFIVGMGLAAAGAYTILRQNAIAESVQNRIILETASAIRYYTDHNVDPLLKEQLKIQFLPESIPFFSAKVTLQTLAKKLEGYTCREPTLNPIKLERLGSRPPRRVSQCWVDGPLTASEVPRLGRSKRPAMEAFPM